MNTGVVRLVAVDGGLPVPTAFYVDKPSAFALLRPSGDVTIALQVQNRPIGWAVWRTRAGKLEHTHIGAPAAAELRAELRAARHELPEPSPGALLGALKGEWSGEVHAPGNELQKVTFARKLTSYLVLHVTSGQSGGATWTWEPTKSDRWVKVPRRKGTGKTVSEAMHTAVVESLTDAVAPSCSARDTAARRAGKGAGELVSRTPRYLFEVENHGAWASEGTFGVRKGSGRAPTGAHAWIVAMDPRDVSGVLRSTIEAALRGPVLTAEKAAKGAATVTYTDEDGNRTYVARKLAGLLKGGTVRSAGSAGRKGGGVRLEPVVGLDKDGRPVAIVMPYRDEGTPRPTKGR